MTRHEYFITYKKFACDLAKYMYYKNYINCPFFDYEDATQCALLGLWQASERYNNENATSFKTFAYKRIIGTIRDNLRDCSPSSRHFGQLFRINKSYDVEDSNLLDNYKYDPTENFIDSIDKDKQYYLIKQLLPKLSIEQQEVFCWVFYKNLSHVQIGTCLNKHPSTIASLLQHAKDRLKKLVKMYLTNPTMVNNIPEKRIEKLSQFYLPQNIIEYEIKKGDKWINKRRLYIVSIIDWNDENITYIRLYHERTGIRYVRKKNVFMTRRSFFKQFKHPDIPLGFKIIFKN